MKNEFLGRLGFLKKISRYLKLPYLLLRVVSILKKSLLISLILNLSKQPNAAVIQI
jgi:hypothetical protein